MHFSPKIYWHMLRKQILYIVQAIVYAFLVIIEKKAGSIGKKVGGSTAGIYVGGGGVV